MKEDLADLCIEHIAPIRNLAIKLLDDQLYLDTIFKKSAEKAAHIANSNLSEIKKIIGF